MQLTFQQDNVVYSASCAMETNGNEKPLNKSASVYPIPHREKNDPQQNLFLNSHTSWSLLGFLLV